MGQASVSESIHAVEEAITVVGRQQGWVCDAHMRIVDIDPRFPGSCHDSYVWRHLPQLGRLTINLRRGEWVLVDSGYPLEPWLLTPVPGHPGFDTQEGRYNRVHASMRNVVERGIGVLKASFRCLQRHRTLLYQPKDAASIVAACVALHNIASKAGEPQLQNIDEEAEDKQPPLQQGLPVFEGHHTCRQETPRELLMRAKQMSQDVSLFSAAPTWRRTYLRALHRHLRQQQQARHAA
ncbi:putative nuclease HARBI1 [Dermacentor andersoni]|uniref:putative nuclease HARBI1 n=1 Tax=Dermacentor andersoni TaxID=34620 RepID=UPI002155F5A5|nr:putative nuclease HARBI1 [Dermacentor andersoni]